MMNHQAVWEALRDRFVEIASQVKAPTYQSDRLSLLAAAREHGLRVAKEGTITIQDGKYRIQDWHFRSTLS